MAPPQALARQRRSLRSINSRPAPSGESLPMSLAMFPPVSVGRERRPNRLLFRQAKARRPRLGRAPLRALPLQRTWWVPPEVGLPAVFPGPGVEFPAASQAVPGKYRWACVEPVGRMRARPAAPRQKPGWRDGALLDGPLTRAGGCYPAQL